MSKHLRRSERLGPAIYLYVRCPLRSDSPWKNLLTGRKAQLLEEYVIRLCHGAGRWQVSCFDERELAAIREVFENRCLVQESLKCMSLTEDASTRNLTLDWTESTLTSFLKARYPEAKPLVKSASPAVWSILMCFASYPFSQLQEQKLTYHGLIHALSLAPGRHLTLSHMNAAGDKRLNQDKGSRSLGERLIFLALVNMKQTPKNSGPQVDQMVSLYEPPPQDLLEDLIDVLAAAKPVEEMVKVSGIGRSDLRPIALRLLAGASKQQFQYRKEQSSIRSFDLFSLVKLLLASQLCSVPVYPGGAGRWSLGHFVARDLLLEQGRCLHNAASDVLRAFMPCGDQGITWSAFDDVITEYLVSSNSRSVTLPDYW